MNAVNSRTGNGVLRRGVLALVVLLLACTLLAGAVSATGTEPVTVMKYDQLIENLSMSNGPTTIYLGADINAPQKISVNRSVTIDGGYHTIKAVPTGSWATTPQAKHLLDIEPKGETEPGQVTLKNITFENEEKACGVQVYKTGATQMILENIIVNGSRNDSIHVNGANVSLVNVTTQNSLWNQSIDISQGSGVTQISVLTIDAQTQLKEAVQINTDTPGMEKAIVNLPANSPYQQHSFYYKDGSYKEQKHVWATSDKIADAAAAIATSKSVSFNASVKNESELLTYHAAALGDVLETYADAGATVTQLKDVQLSQPIIISKDGITFDGANKKITTTGTLTEGHILKVAVEKTEDSTSSVTLQNLDITGTEAGSTGSYGGITIDAGKNGNEQKTSVPVTLKDSTIDMSGVTATASMNPAVYFVSADGSKIENNVIKAGITDGTADGVSSRGISINGGTGITISENQITMGTSAKASVGIQFQGAAESVTLSGNTITTPETNGNNVPIRAVDITTVGI